MLFLTVCNRRQLLLCSILYDIVAISPTNAVKLGSTTSAESPIAGTHFSSQGLTVAPVEYPIPGALHPADWGQPSTASQIQAHPLSGSSWQELSGDEMHSLTPPSISFGLERNRNQCDHSQRKLHAFLPTSTSPGPPEVHQQEHVDRTTSYTWGIGPRGSSDERPTDTDPTHTPKESSIMRTSQNVPINPNHHHQAGQLHSVPPHADLLATCMDAGTSVPRSKKGRTKRTPSPADQTSLGLTNDDLIKGYRSATILKKYRDIFFAKCCSREVKVAGRGVKRVVHPNLPMVMYARPNDESGVSIYVLDKFTGQSQRTYILADLYHYLIKCMLIFHEERLNSSNVATFWQREWHERLLAWLEGEISPLSEDQRLPIIGTRKSSICEWKSDDKFGPTQIKLIKYFSRIEKKDKFGPGLARDLVETFHAQDSIKMSIFSCDLPDFTQIEPNFIFQNRMESLMKYLQTPEKVSIFEKLVYKREFTIQQEGIPSLYISRFKEQFFETNLLGKPRTIHPKLPIAIYFVNEDLDDQVVRILHQSLGKKPVQYDEIISRLRKLLKAIEYISLKVSKFFEMPEQESSEIRNTIFEWVHYTIFGTPGVIPILGIYKADRDYAPWEYNRNGNFKFFKMIHLQLIKYFSEKESLFNLMTTSAFVLTTWDQDNFPTYLETIFKFE
ncbi:hypothetical protein PSTG_09131 [Puccinia striiformis f. sp. tritici PST-78]|uniref:Uncharacterized protein n=1 Tax=Puccinia striiformis f. sp. tritici PST-78 TaxID=1165861 RepID=A0A0L0VE88_9BASI|nr:hypothetical protein PSTG_09131 [Puccinia striiformis f. sp. tritici PST-78]